MAWRVSLRGLQVGESTPYPWTAGPPVIFGIAKPRTNVAPKPAAWGEVAFGPDLADATDITFQIRTDAFTETDALTLFEQFQTAWQTAPADLALTIEAPNQTYLARGRPGPSACDLTDSLQGVIVITALFRRQDPRFYDISQSLASSITGVVSGGMSWPFTWPFAWGAISAGETNLTNTGNAATGLHIVVDPQAGGYNAPLWRVLNTGEVLSLPSLSLTASQFLVIDFDAGTVAVTPDLSDPTQYADVGNYIDRSVSNWWTGSRALGPGTSTIDFAGSGTARVTYTWRNAWLL